MMQQRKSKKIVIYFFLLLLVGSINNINLNNLKLGEINSIKVSGLEDLDNLFDITKPEIEKIINIQKS